MQLSNILADIEKQFPLCQCVCKDETVDIWAALIGAGNPEILHAVRAYFGPVPENAPGTSSADCCLCLCQFALPAPNRICAPDPDTLAEVFNWIQGRLSKAQTLAELERQILHKDLNIQNIVDQATEILENPLLVANTSFQILGISDMEIDDSAWRHFRERQQVPFHPDTARGHEQFLQDIQQGRLIKVVDGKHKKGFFIRCAVMFGNLFLAQVHIFSMLREFLATDLELAAQLSGLLGVAIMRSSPDHNNIHTTSEYLISDLILGKLTDQRSIQARLEYINWPLRRYKYLLLMPWDGDEKTINFQDACISNLCRIFPDGRSVVNGDCVVVLFSTDSELNTNSPELERVRQQIARTKQRGVLSFPFEDLTDTAYRYLQTQDILSLCCDPKQPARFLLAESCSVDLMIAQAGVKYRLADYCHPLVRRLLEYEDRAGREHLDTLRAYIETGRSFTKAAERLHMHRNSVIYRMKQIEDILEYDFSRDEFTFHLQLSFRILDYIEREHTAP